jgi:F420-non-reducing hydrogenase iron-sulfur subunit
MTETFPSEQVPSEPASFEPAPFEPKIAGFLCNWCSYAGADKAGAAQIPYPPNVHVMRVMCSGRIDPEFVLQVFRKGADGVLILACHAGDCHYKEGNYRAIQRHRLLLRLLGQFGIAPERCRFDFVAASEGEKYARVLTEMVENIRSLGPLVLDR